MNVDTHSFDKMIQIHPLLQIEMPPQQEDGLLIAVWGQIRQEAAQNFKVHLMKIFEQESAPKVMLDFARVDFIDSQGLAVIYELFRQLKEAGRTFEIINASANIANLFLLTRLHRLFTIR